MVVLILLSKLHYRLLVVFCYGIVWLQVLLRLLYWYFDKEFRHFRAAFSMEDPGRLAIAQKAYRCRARAAATLKIISYLKVLLVGVELLFILLNAFL